MIVMMIAITPSLNASSRPLPISPRLYLVVRLEDALRRFSWKKVGLLRQYIYPAGRRALPRGRKLGDRIRQWSEGGKEVMLDRSAWFAARVCGRRAQTLESGVCPLPGEAQRPGSLRVNCDARE